MRQYEIKQPTATEVIKRDCAPYRNEMGGFRAAIFGAPLWRGIRQKSVEKYGLQDRVLTTVRPHLNRKPSDTPLVAHQYFDNWFLGNFGYRHRSQSFFTSGSKSDAIQYGTACVFFPIGEYQICWSPKIRGLFKEFDTGWASPHRLLGGDDDLSGLPEDEIQELVAESIAENGHYTDENLLAAIKSGNEVMVACNAAYLLPESYQLQLLSEYNGYA